MPIDFAESNEARVVKTSCSEILISPRVEGGNGNISVCGRVKELLVKTE